MVLVIAASISSNARIDVADAGQQSGSAVGPVFAASIGTLLVTLALALSSPALEKKNREVKH